MTKSDLVYELAVHSNITASLAENIVNTIFDSMKEAVVSGDKVEIRGFGSIVLRDYEGYTGRNPISGEQVAIKPKKRPYFKAGKEICDRLRTAHETLAVLERNRRP
jgi:integration host factor subunit beta